MRMDEKVSIEYILKSKIRNEPIFTGKIIKPDSLNNQFTSAKTAIELS